MEWTLVHWGWNFNLRYQVVVLQVIWVIGLSMLLLSVLVASGLSPRGIGAIGAVLILGHNLLDWTSLGGTLSGPGGENWIRSLLLRQGVISLGDGSVTLITAYPLLPWFGVMAAGFGFGEVLGRTRGNRIRSTASFGLALTLAFVLLRVVNRYGDPTPWKVQDTGVRTILSFLNCQKYPPSLLYVLMTLGPALLALAVFEVSEDYLTRPTGVIRRALETLGRVPLFFYLLQWPVIHMLANITATITKQPVDWYSWSFDYPPGYGYSLPAVYAMWAVTIAMLYFPSRWYAGLKRRHRDLVWLSYL